MAKMNVVGIDEYIKAIQRVSNDSDIVIRKGIYEGSGVMADALKNEVRKLPTDNSYGTNENPSKGITNRQKADLIDGFGIAPIREDGDFLNVKLGWDGYGRTKTKKYKKGVPNQLIVRSVNSGTSFRRSIPFVNRTVNKNRNKVQQVMAKVIQKEIEKEMK